MKNNVFLVIKIERKTYDFKLVVRQILILKNKKKIQNNCNALL